MRSLKHRELAFLLVGSLAAAAPAYASGGSDDDSCSSSSNSSTCSSSTSGTAGTSNTSGTAGTTGTRGTSGAFGTSGTSCSNGRHGSNSSSTSGSSCTFTSSDPTTKVKGTFKLVERHNGSKVKLELMVKIGKKGLDPIANIDTSVLRAIFPTGEVCEMEGVGHHHSRKSLTYLLKAKVRNDVFSDRIGECFVSSDPNALPLSVMPALTDTDIITLEFDADDSLATPNVKIAEIQF